SRSTASPPTAAAPRERPPLSLHDALPISMPGRVLAGIGLQAAVIVLFYLITTYMLTLATNVHGFTRGDTLIILLIAGTIDLFAMLAFAVLSDRFPARRMFLIGSVFTAVFALDRKSTRLNSSHVKISY